MSVFFSFWYNFSRKIIDFTIPVVIHSEYLCFFIEFYFFCLVNIVVLMLQECYELYLNCNLDPHLYHYSFFLEFQRQQLPL